MSSRLEVLSRIALIIMAVIAIFTALDYGQNVFAPIMLAFVIGIVMTPLSDFVDRAGLPPGMAALGSLLLILFFLFGLFLFLEPTIRRAVAAMPVVLSEANEIVRDMRQSLRGLEEASEDVSRALGNGQRDEGEASGVPSVEDALLMAPQIASQLMIFSGTLFFFILTRKDIYAYLAHSIAPKAMRHELTKRLRSAEKQVARYFLTITLINTAYALVVTAVMAALGMPSPVLWGISAGLLNFVLYLGPATFVVALLLGGLYAFEGVYSFAPAGAYLALNILESQFVTPALVGKHLHTNPLAIFMALVFFLWLWGPIGGVIAIPLLLWVIAIATEARSVVKKSEPEAV